MSRIPRVQEYLKTGFTAEAAAAAKFRAYAERARRDGLPNLADRWLTLAAAKDELAIRQLEATGKVRGGLTDLAAEIAEERYENDVLYPKLIAALDDPAVSTLLASVIEAQQEHLRRLLGMRDELTSSKGDVAKVVTMPTSATA